MFKALTDLLRPESKPSTQPMTTELAVAAILVHLARVDGDFSDTERKTISNTLAQHFDLDAGQVQDLLDLAKKKDADAVDLYQFTSQLTALDMDQRIAIIEMMWKLVFADRENHELEDNLVWRVAELIGVSARDRTTLRARFRAAANMPEDEDTAD